MLEVQEILELERKWRVYDKQRKGSKVNKDKKYQTYMLVALLAASVTTASLVFFYFEDVSINIAKNTSSATYEIKDAKVDQVKKPEIIINEDLSNASVVNLNDTTQEPALNDNSIKNEQEASSSSESINDMERTLAQNDDIKPVQESQDSNLDLAENTSKEVTNIRQQVLFKAPSEEIINLGIDNANLKSGNSIDSQKGFKFEIQSSNLDMSVDELKTKFDKSNSSDLAVLIAKKYYDIEDYKSSEKWALIANELNSENEESWVIFAKSKYNLGQKYDAVKVLRIYNDKANSKEIEDLIKHIESNAI